MKLRTRTNQPVEGDELENLKLSGDLEVEGDISGDAITGDSIIENMTGYSAEARTQTGYTFEPVYISACKNGNKLTLVFALNITKTSADADAYAYISNIIVPSSLYPKLYPVTIGTASVLDAKSIALLEDLNSVVSAVAFLVKSGTSENPQITSACYMPDAVLNTKYYFRYEVTILLSDNLLPQE